MKMGLFSLGERAVSHMDHETDHEQTKENQTKRIRVEGFRQAAHAHGHRRVGVLLTAFGVFILGLWGVRVLGLSRPPLEEERRQYDIGAHLQELALPILEERAQEVC